MRISIKDNKIKLYGIIWDGDGEYISRELESIDGNYSSFDVHLHTKGGSVFDGDLIYNTLITMKSEINIYIDGLAASMGSIIMLAGKKIYASKSAFIMTHAPRGSVYGTASDLESTAGLLRSMESNFIDKYSSKTGKDKKDVKKLLEGDNWFSASDALKEGLIDGVVPDVMDKSAILNHKELKIAACLKGDDPIERILAADPQNINKQINKSKSNIMKQQLISVFAFLQAKGLNEESSDTAFVKALSEEVTSLQAKKEALEKELKDIKEKQEKERNEAIESLVNKAIADRKIDASEKDTYLSIGKNTGVQALESVLSKLGAVKPLTQAVQSGNAAGLKYKTWDEFQAKDPRGLEALKSENPELFNQLFKAKYGRDF